MSINLKSPSRHIYQSTFTFADRRLQLSWLNSLHILPFFPSPLGPKCQYCSATRQNYANKRIWFNLYHSLGKFSRWQIDDMFFLYIPENSFWHFMQIVSIGDNLHEISNPVSRENKKDISKCCLLKILPIVLSITLCQDKRDLDVSVKLHKKT